MYSFALSKPWSEPVMAAPSNRIRKAFWFLQITGNINEDLTQSRMCKLHPHITKQQKRMHVVHGLARIANSLLPLSLFAPHLFLNSACLLSEQGVGCALSALACRS
mmetsp:Transcript_4142/g.14745  ORF Transcript_4142/g.14745 Transcript_4142/m.14745 type:complete len:106 (-) Transcript_4142:430-747(-)